MGNLTKYGHTYQLKIIAGLFNDNDFMASCVDALLPEYFESRQIRWVINKFIEYYRQYKCKPTPDVMATYVMAEPDASQEELKKILVDAYGYTVSEDLTFIKSDVIRFCQIQAVRKVLLDSVTLLDAGEIDEIRLRMTEAIKIGAPLLKGIVYKDTVKRRYELNPRIPIPTGWDVIDMLTKGGLAGGELGLLIAPTGIGKTWGLIAIGCGAIKAGKNVLHVTLELNEDYVAIRYDQVVFTMSVPDLTSDLNTLIDRVSALPGNLEIVKFPGKKLSLDGLRDHMMRVIAKGFNIDMLIVDYADLLKLPESKKKRKDELLEDLFIDLHNVAEEFDIPVWTASQTNRGGMDDKFVQNKDVSEAIGKIFTSDFAMSFNRSAEDKSINSAKVTINKNRFGPDGEYYSMYMDTTIGMLDIRTKTAARLLPNEIMDAPAKKLLLDKFTRIQQGKSAGIQ